MSEKKKIDLNVCKLSWVEGKPVLECPKEAIVAATTAIQTEGILIKEIRIVKES